MEQSPLWETNTSLASQEIPCIYMTKRFVTMLTTVHHLSVSCHPVHEGPCTYMYESVLYYKHSIPSTCFDHSSGHPQGGVVETCGKNTVFIV